MIEKKRCILDHTGKLFQYDQDPLFYYLFATSTARWIRLIKVQGVVTMIYNMPNN
jgi:hypothetical protein